MKHSNSSILFEDASSVRIERSNELIVLVVAQGPHGGAAHIMLTDDEARALLALLERKLDEVKS